MGAAGFKDSIHRVIIGKFVIGLQVFNNWLMWLPAFYLGREGGEVHLFMKVQTGFWVHSRRTESNKHTYLVQQEIRQKASVIETGSWAQFRRTSGVKRAEDRRRITTGASQQQRAEGDLLCHVCCSRKRKKGKEQHLRTCSPDLFLVLAQLSCTDKKHGDRKPGCSHGGQGKRRGMARLRISGMLRVQCARVLAPKYVLISCSAFSNVPCQPSLWGELPRVHKTIATSFDRDFRIVATVHTGT